MPVLAECDLSTLLYVWFSHYVVAEEWETVAHWQ